MKPPPFTNCVQCRQPAAAPLEKRSTMANDWTPRYPARISNPARGALCERCYQANRADAAKKARRAAAHV